MTTTDNNDWVYWARTSKLRIQSPLPYQFGEYPISCDA
ncbi:hypothetical protein LVISKB_0758 [Levilactobacillus brevis KB290]|uniref:Uncharacterized protein n=1 Tax=Levilactobacillus brevis KB290 TaxID=1001583 RepID=M5AC38_LEVBR|nr:hypothetical protein LVISKB_0758 [Levilactobacillus brevis KB290]